MARLTTTLLALMVCGLTAPLGAQQPNNAQASMIWGGIDGPAWPITAEVYPDVPSTSGLTVDMAGTAQQGYAITHAPAGLLSAGLNGPFGIIDQDLSGGLEVLFDGLFAGAASFPGYFAVLGTQGTSSWSFPLLATATFSLPGLQSIVGDPGAAFGFTLSAATSLQVLPYPYPCSPSAPGILSLGDDNFVNFAFTGRVVTFYGIDYPDAYVNSNGNITFGSGDIDFTPSGAEFGSGPPRIAPLWHDLSPNISGDVRATQVGNTFYVSWNDVPAFACPGSANTFCCRIALRTGAPSTQQSSFSFEYANLAPCSPSGGGAIVVGCTPGSAGTNYFADFSAGMNFTPMIVSCGIFTSNFVELAGAAETFADSTTFDLGPGFGGPTTIQFTPQANIISAQNCSIEQRWYTLTAIP